MNKIKFNLVHENELYKVYENEYYKIGIEKNTNNIIKIESLGFSPNLYIKNDIENLIRKEDKIKIESVGYGAIDKEELKQLIKGYQIALETVDEIEKNFL